MRELERNYDVFISHALKDRTLAMELADVLRESGLNAFTDGETPQGQDHGDVVWDALAESRALLSIVSPSGPTASMAIEMGAARAWNKPIYAIVTDPTSTRKVPGMAGVPLYTTGRLADVVTEIRAGAERLTDEDRAVLARLYAQMAVSADQLAIDPRQLKLLADRFVEQSGKSVEGEYLLSELLRLRKRGLLSRKRTRTKTRTRRREPA